MTSTVADTAAAEARKAQVMARLSGRELASHISAQTPLSNAHTHGLSQTPDAIKAQASRQASRAPKQQAAGASPAEAARAKQTFSETSEAEQAGRKGSAAKYLWGAVVGQQWDPAVPAASAVDGQQAASLNGASHGSGMLSRTEGLVAIGDRQAHKPVLPQVGAEQILTTHSAVEQGAVCATH